MNALLHRTYALFAFATLWLVLSPQVSQAQFVTTVQKVHHDSLQVYGNDFWFGIPKNGEDQAGKYNYLYITSGSAANVHVQIGSLSAMLVKVTPYITTAVNIPLGMEIKSTNVLETKAIHVWSDVGVQLLLVSHGPYSSDATPILPTVQCGSDYVIASYQSLISQGSDFPSEFTIVALYDNTQVIITPSAPLRGLTPTSIQFQAGSPFTITMHKGETIQYQSVEGLTNTDLTGTTLHSSAPVGVIGASSCPNIPNDAPYCDFVMEMMSPQSAWGTTYYTAPTFNRLKGDSFLIINSETNQTIHRYSAAEGNAPDIVMTAPFSSHRDSNINSGSRWTSEKPFYLVQYTNSSTFDCASCGFGDPSMMVIQPLSTYSRSTTLTIPPTQGSENAFTAHINLFVPAGASRSTTFDGISITNFTKITIDGNYEVYRLDNMKPGAHPFHSDSNIMANFYGYGSYESYSASVAPPLRSLAVSDTVAPDVALDNGLTCLRMDASDGGSGLYGIDTSSVVNLLVQRDPSFIPGQGMAAGYITLCVLDTQKLASASVTITDKSGNSTTVTLSRQPSKAAPITFYAYRENTFVPIEIGQAENIAAVWVIDSVRDVTIDSAWTTDPHFFYDPTVPNTSVIPFVLPAGTEGHLGFTFISTDTVEVVATALIRSKEAGTRTVTLRGKGLPSSSSVWDDRNSGYSQQFESWLPHGTDKLFVFPATPNPTSGKLQLTYGLRESAIVHVNVYDILGTSVYHFSFESNAGVSQQSIDLTALPAGSYLYRLDAAGEVHSARFEVTH